MSNNNYNKTYIFGISLISALGGYLFGFDFAVITGALPFLEKQFALNDYWAGFATGCLALGAIVGCIIAGLIADRFGRRAGLLTAALIFAISSLAMAISQGRDSFMFFRFAAGIGVGMASMLSPMYIAEISPAHYRGRMVAINQLTVVLGILFTNIINYSLRNVGDDAWRWMFGLGAAPSILFFAGALFLPESPRWLAGTGKLAKATAVLEKIGGKEFAQSSVNSIKASLMNAEQVKFSMVFNRAIFPALIIGIVLATFQQFSGINVVFNYTPKIFESIGVGQDEQLLQTVFIGLVNVFFSVLAILLVDKVGRKPLMLFGAGGLSIVYIAIVNLLSKSSGNVSWYLLVAIAIYAVSLAPVTWVLISELFPNKVRSLAITITVLCLWLAYFLLVFTFPVLFSRFGDGTFYIYSAVCFLGMLFIIFKVSETKNRSLEEIGSGVV